MDTFEIIIVDHEKPERNGIYHTDKGELYWFGDEKTFSCRKDRISEEYPKWWLKKSLAHQKNKEIIERAQKEIDKLQKSLTAANELSMKRVQEIHELRKELDTANEFIVKRTSEIRDLKEQIAQMEDF